VLAAPEWGGEPERMRVVPALPGSVEALLHEVALPRFFLPLRDALGAPAALRESRLERSLGPIHPAASGEPGSQYFYARLAEQFDAVIHLDRTRAVEALERTAQPREPGPWPESADPP
jgi:erythromycin esterase-like protein